MKKVVMDHAMSAELKSPEYTPAATRQLFMDPEVYCAVISVAVAHGVAKLFDKEERRKTITAKTQAMRDFFAEMAEGEMNEINGTPVLRMLDGQVNEEFGAWTPITTSLQGWVDLMENIAQGLSTVIDQRPGLGALELVPAKPSRRFFANRGAPGGACRDLCVANGVISRAVYDTMIAAPPLVITPGEIDELVARVARALDQTAARVVQEVWS